MYIIFSGFVKQGNPRPSIFFFVFSIEIHGFGVPSFLVNHRPIPSASPGCCTSFAAAAFTTSTAGVQLCSRRSTSNAWTCTSVCTRWRPPVLSWFKTLVTLNHSNHSFKHYKPLL